jgi:cephalosporin hydroxylase
VAKDKGTLAATGVYNAIVDLRRRPKVPSSGLLALDEIRERSGTRTDINDHLVTLFVESVAVNPRLIVELGVRQGESTFVLERVARLCQSKLVSVDLEDCTHVCKWPGWFFVKGDDLEFAGTFASWCRERKIDPHIDVLFVDTSHLLEHTRREIECWFPHLAKRAKVFFHDTNTKKIYFRKDGSVAFGWDNQRGVITSIEKFLQRSYNEEEDFMDVAGEWIVRHHSYCAGFTVLERVCPFA